MTVEDIGVVQQLEIYEHVQRLTGTPAPVVDAGEFLKAPEAQLRALCDLLRIDFTPRMLSWPPGPRASDGVWAPYWYDKVLDSSGFEPRAEHQSQVPPGYRDVVDAVMPSFEVLFARRLLQ